MSMLLAALLAPMPPSASDYPSEVLSDSPYVYYRLGESSGTTAVDSSGNSRDGTYSGTLTLSQTSLLSTETNTSVLFNGGTLETPSVTIPTGSGADFTIEFWIKYTSTGAQMLFDEAPGGDTNNRVFVQLNRNAAASTINGFFRVAGRTSAGGGGAGTFSVAPSSNPNINDGNPHHIVITRSGTTFVIYIDGSSVSLTIGDAVESGPMANAGQTERIGTDESSVQPLNNVTADEFAIYHSVLSGARVSAHYNAGV